MGLLTLIVALFVAISFMFAPSASHQVYDANFSLPRKLKINEEANVKSFMPQHKKFIAPSSVSKEQENVPEAATAAAEEEGARRERTEEGPQKSEYFSMDYGWVRKRRPIHNKQIPFVP